MTLCKSTGWLEQKLLLNGKNQLKLLFEDVVVDSRFFSICKNKLKSRNSGFQFVKTN
jgi:hypothetical protein